MLLLLDIYPWLAALCPLFSDLFKGACIDPVLQNPGVDPQSEASPGLSPNSLLSP